MLISDIDEFGLINRLHNLVKSNSNKVKVGIGDDGAVIENNPESQTVITTDMLIEDIHFLKDKTEPFLVGYKSLAVNISDIVAMGASPNYMAISLGVPHTTKVKYLEKVYKGIKSLAQKYKIDIIGGDTTSSPDKLVINITLLGEVTKNNYLLRSKAQIDNHILVTGTIGASKAGLEILLADNHQQLKLDYPELVKKHLQPEPRLEEIELIKNISPITSMNDISDGLASELIEITTASKVGAEIYQEKIPISSQTKKLAQKLNDSYLDYALFGGEDYELIFTVPAGESDKIKKSVEKKFETKVSIIGKVLSPEAETKLITSQGRVKLKKKGYNHFKFD